MNAKPILNVENLRVEFRARSKSVIALRDVSFAIEAGKTLALVGESGSGKSVTSLAIMGLLPGNGRISAGSIRYTGASGTIDVAKSNQSELRTLRGAEISMIFQEPMSSLNPLFTIGDQIGEMLILHSDMDAATRTRRVIEMLELVEIPGAKSRVNSYPHEMSGGMRQRVMIALAIICNPTLLIADEPTTALDVTIQAQILDLLRKLQNELAMSVLFITHDMGVVAEVADTVAVMYAGAVVEHAPAGTLFANPLHPYTQGLLNSIPVPGNRAGKKLMPIKGSVPSLQDMPPGCAFSPRCAHFASVCTSDIALTQVGEHHVAACHALNEPSA